jgi:acetyl/propionyl-CoA carboxylase alpha subunit
MPKLIVNNKEVAFTPGSFTVERNGSALHVSQGGQATSARYVVDPSGVWISYRGRQYRIEPKQFGQSNRAASSGEIHAEMPGAVVDVMVNVGDSVTAGSLWKR